jgi:hypothetical protein
MLSMVQEVAEEGLEGGRTPCIEVPEEGFNEMSPLSHRIEAPR